VVKYKKNTIEGIKGIKGIKGIEGIEGIRGTGVIKKMPDALVALDALSIQL
jgi:hypothetical protein